MQEARDFIRESQQTRTAIRRITCLDGYCLVVDNDPNAWEILRRFLSSAGIEARLAESIDDAIGTLHRDSKRIICAIIGQHINGTGSGSDVIRQIERENTEVPYIVYTDSADDAAKVANHFPRANVVLRGQDADRLLVALGLS